MSNKKFTILTASNYGRYLDDWSSSIIAQNYRPLEVIFVNDKSKDNTIEKIKKISGKFKKNGIEFKFIQPKKKLYCGSSYRLALKYATGKYFGVLDSDDMLESFSCFYIASIYDKFPEITWLYTQYNKYNRMMTRIIKKGFCCLPPHNHNIMKAEQKGMQIFSHWRTFSVRLPKKDTIFKKKLRGCVDKYMGYRMEELGKGMFVNRICYKYRRRNSGESPISHKEPLLRIKNKIFIEREKQRKKEKIKCFPILHYKN